MLQNLVFFQITCLPRLSKTFYFSAKIQPLQPRTKSLIVTHEDSSTIKFIKVIRLMMKDTSDVSMDWNQTCSRHYFDFGLWVFLCHPYIKLTQCPCINFIRFSAMH